MSDTDIPKSTRMHLLLSVLLLSSATIFAISGDAPQTFFLAAAGLLGSALRRRPLPRTQRTFIYAGLAALVIAMLSDQILPVSPRRFFLMPAQIYCPGVILLGVAATYFDQRESNITAVIALSLVATMMAGNVLGFPEPSQRLPLLGTYLTAHFHVFYGCVVAVQLGTMLLVLRLAPGRLAQERTGKHYRWAKRTTIVAALLLAVGGVFAVRNTAFHYERSLQGVFASWFEQYVYRRSHWIVFGNQVNLWRTVPFLRRRDKAVVLRAECPSAPGYLRGRVFLTYGNGHWSEDDNGRSMPSHEAGGRLAFQVFERPLSMVPAARVHRSGRKEEYLGIYPAPQFRSNVLLAPGNTARIDIIADSLTNNADGVMVPSGWEQQVGYFLHLDMSSPGHAYQGPAITPADEAAYLQVPVRLRRPLDNLAAGIFGPKTPGEDTRFEIEKLIAFFRKHFKYKLGVRMPSLQVDPVLQFLQTTHKGHCELFATAAVLLLRSRGIPARYVTGFVCNEPSPSGHYWISRLEDAHAWAEAYLPERGAWTTVEATPPSGVPNGEEQLGMLGSPLDRIALAWQQFWSLMKRGYIAQAIVTAAVSAVHALWLAVKNPVGGTLFLLLLLYAARVLRRRLRARAVTQGGTLSPPRAELCGVYARILANLNRCGIEYPPNATPLELAGRIRSHTHLPHAARLAAVIEAYLPLRFSGAPPTQAQVEAFRSRASEVLRAARREQRRKTPPARSHDFSGE